MEQVTISPETIMELMAERDIMPEDVYQGLISQEDCQKHKKNPVSHNHLSDENPEEL